MDNSTIIIISVIAVSFILLVISIIVGLFVYSLKKIDRVSSTVDAISVDAPTGGKKRKKQSIRTSLKTVVKACRAIINQKPQAYESNAQLKNFNILLKDADGKLSLYTADDVIGAELISAMEDLGIEWVLDKI